MRAHDLAPASSMVSLVSFFLGTFALTWTCFIAAGAWLGPPSTSDAAAILSGALFFLGIFAPSIVALWLTGRAEGRAGVVTLLQRLFEWRVSARWYVFALAYMATVKLAGALVYRGATGEWPRFGSDPWYFMLAATLLSTALLGQAGEEIGWRGYALPRLSARFGLGPASIVLGVVWAVWHLPLFYIQGADTTGQSFPLYLLNVTALSVAMAWLYAHTNGSLLLAMLMHAAINNTKDIVPSVGQAGPSPFALNPALQPWLTVGVLWICATYFLVRMRAVPRASIASPARKESA